VTILVDEPGPHSGAGPEDHAAEALLPRLPSGHAQRGRLSGKLRDVDLTVAAFSLLGMINWLSRWYQADGSRRTSDRRRSSTSH
jgi:hypothetical protein